LTTHFIFQQNDKELVMDESRWSLGTLIWVPVSILLTVVCIVASIIFYQWWKRERGGADSGFLIGVSICAAIAAFCLVVGTMWGMYPFKTEYHKWIITKGTVENVDSRFLADGQGGTTERFVVTFDDGRLRSCDDSRCSQVKPGGTLVLACKRAWQYSGTDGYDCNFESYKRR
jgi:heme/copper-type cytochrome/quinol oxidase subunit 4